MASILDKYGIKEVADITFYALDGNGVPAYPVLYIDTAKTSTIEQTADEATANGGKGNPALISWDFNKDINVTLEDALFSAKSLAIMFGNGKVSTIENGKVMKTEVFSTKASRASIAALKTSGDWKDEYEGPNGKIYTKQNSKFYDANGKSVAAFEANTKYFCTFDLNMNGSVIEIGANTFPGTYYVTGDTFARSQASGEDEFFQFIINKAKVLSENSITLEADGDPSVFSMNLHVLRPEVGPMIQLVKYDLTGGTDSSESTTDLYHNHNLNGVQAYDETEEKWDYTTPGTVEKADTARAEGINDAGTAWIENADVAES